MTNFTENVIKNGPETYASAASTVRNGQKVSFLTILSKCHKIALFSNSLALSQMTGRVLKVWNLVNFVTFLTHLPGGQKPHLPQKPIKPGEHFLLRVTAARPRHRGTVAPWHRGPVPRHTHCTKDAHPGWHPAWHMSGYLRVWGPKSGQNVIKLVKLSILSGQGWEPGTESRKKW